MRVTIFMCAYNAEGYIDKAIQSILGQTYTNWELLISNDKSTDNTRTIIESYLHDTRIKLYNQPVNLGIVKGKNWLLKKVNGDLITQLDADDFYAPDTLEKQVAVFNKFSDIRLCAINTAFVDANDNLISCTKHPEDLLITKRTGNDYPFMFAGLMFSSAIKEEAGFFSEYFIGVPGDDHYWTIKINAKYPIYFLKEPLYYYRIHATSYTATLSANPRKLIGADLINELHRQRMETGTDWLETGELEKMQAFEESVLNNPVIMGEKYRIAGAKETDKKNWVVAGQLLAKSFRLNKYNPSLYRTLIYYYRSRFF